MAYGSIVWVKLTGGARSESLDIRLRKFMPFPWKRKRIQPNAFQAHIQEFLDPKIEGLSIQFAFLRLGLLDTNNMLFRPAVRTRRINQIELVLFCSSARVPFVSSFQFVLISTVLITHIHSIHRTQAIKQPLVCAQHYCEFVLIRFD
jgi:hypothetical protein